MSRSDGRAADKPFSWTAAGSRPKTCVFIAAKAGSPKRRPPEPPLFCVHCYSAGVATRGVHRPQGEKEGTNSDFTKKKSRLRNKLRLLQARAHLTMGCSATLVAVSSRSGGSYRVRWHQGVI